MKRLFYILNIIVFASGLSSCSTKAIDNFKEYAMYLNKAENGLVKEKSVSGLHYRLKFLPKHYQAFTTLNGLDSKKINKDSLVAAYSKSITFLLTIGPAEGEDFDITRVGVKDYQEFADRIEDMSFRANEWMRLKCGEVSVVPSLVRMENINAQERSRNFIVVFEQQDALEKAMKESDTQFIYDDELFGTGTNKFLFEHKQLNAVPELKL